MRKVEKVDRICQYCGKHFEIYPRRLKEGRGKFCSHYCADRAKVGKHLSNITRQRMSLAHGGQGEIPEYVERVCQYCGKQFSILASKLKSQPGKYCSRLCQNRAQANPLDHKVRKRKAKLVSVTSKARWQKPEYRARLSRSQKVAQRKKWENPEFVTRMLASLNKRPTQPEQRLITILQEAYPQFKYNGDFSLGISLGGLIPDFVNIDGKKEVIEVFGDYFHSPEVVGNRWQGTELGKVMIYNSLGYKCLVIWEHDLKQLTEDEIIDKVKTFFGIRRQVCQNLHRENRRLL